MILFTGPSGPLDLIELIDDVEELATVVIPAGRYGQLRIVLEGAAIEPGARPPRRRGAPRARFRRRGELREGSGMSGRWIVTPVIKLFDDPGDADD